MASLRDIVEVAREYKGLRRKKPLKRLLECARGALEIEGNVLIGLGDDSAVIDLGDRYLLFSSDGIMTELLRKDPRWAGFCSVLVNINDIYAKGGKPLAIVDVLGISEYGECREIMAGITDGCRKFRVPLVGGHLHPDHEIPALSVAIVGIADKDSLISGFGARPGDDIIVAVDLEGRSHPKFPLHWDTVSMKESEELLRQREAMVEIGRRGLASASRDISNPGLLGSLAMLLENSEVGARIELERVPKPEEMEWVDWVRAYPGTGFILTSPQDISGECLRILRRAGLEAEVVGAVTDDMRIYVEMGEDRELFMDLKREHVTGMTRSAVRPRLPKDFNR